MITAGTEIKDAAICKHFVIQDNEGCGAFVARLLAVLFSPARLNYSSSEVFSGVKNMGGF